MNSDNLMYSCHEQLGVRAVSSEKSLELKRKLIRCVLTTPNKLNIRDNSCGPHVR